MKNKLRVLLFGEQEPVVVRTTIYPDVKFQIGQRVWLMDDNKPKSVVVYSIHLTHRGPKYHFDANYFKRGTERWSGTGDVIIDEECLYLTKEELIKAL